MAKKFLTGASGMTYGTGKGSSLGKDMARNLLGVGKTRQADIKMPKFEREETLAAPRVKSGIKYHRGY